MVVVALGDTHGRVPAVGLYLAKELIVFHHARAAGLVVLQAYEATIAKLLTPARQVLRHDVRMDIYLERHVGEFWYYKQRNFFDDPVICLLPIICSLQ